MQIESLMVADAFPHPAGHIELIETHISWVILTDEFVYKIKKPIKLDFLDFSDLDRRKFYCEEEVRLNKPWAPDIYVDVVPITEIDGQARVDGDGEPLEYAVRMRPFDQALRLDKQLDADRLSVADMKELASNIAARHAAAPRVDVSQRDRVIRLTDEFMQDNFTALRGSVDDAELGYLREWTSEELGRTESLLWQRFDDGFVRDCHGDLHLANLVRLPDGITTFDCIEFNPDLRHIDVVADIAFLVMDLVARKEHDLAAHFLNRYLEHTGDYGGVSLLSLFFVYRCLVRAKVAVIRSNERETEADRKSDLDEAHFYCDMARRQATARQPVLVIMSGLSGSGKTWVSAQLMAALPAIRIRSDIERKRLFGLGETETSGSDVGGGIYSKDANRGVYQRLFESARTVMQSGHSVILDAAFLKEAERSAAIDVAASCDSPAVIVSVTAPEGVMRDRIRKRMAATDDASEARLDVLDHQLSTVEPMTAAEKKRSIACDNTGELDIELLVDQIRRVTGKS